ncbi:acyltransferase family protein [Candidatus Nitrosacidococcus tergens]|uniref:Putative Acyltransferase 3 n=1 Tax=Candidatus Nitrosacidococcus tergens TaxID=553981 RepID=A0A7G1Q7M0_9GAMM|nr:acyltransferase family protein [Candidatus Nitrosacidococcus tergens]CAB1274614.1 putative Acyltransferase 3 [Candidatus Nitrosacidococcus tergens]
MNKKDFHHQVSTNHKIESKKLPYRPEIDGMRALAVLSVMLFHAGVPGFSGGFVGVDVFFVISGYLITGILLRENQSGSFSILSFYERRIRRILPALILVLIVCIPFGWFLMDPYSFWRLGQGIVAAITFVSNIYLWQTTGYFTAILENPLVHTWSLGVEEQFYIFFPIFLWGIWRYKRGWLWVALFTVTIISLGVSELGVYFGKPIITFYLSPTRAFELMLGALVAFAAFENKIPKLSKILAELFCWVGILSIALPIMMFDERIPFPGLNALIPSAGSALVIMLIYKDSFLGRLLSSKPFVFVGLISYSAYLWHEPIFAFTHIAGFYPALEGNIGLVLLSLFLAWLSWAYVETPFRDRNIISKPMLLKWAGVSSFIVLLLGLWLIFTHGVSSRFSPEEMKWWKYADNTIQGEYVRKRAKALEGNFTTTEQRKILIIGDSYAQDFVNAVYESNQWQNAQIRTAHIEARCQISYVTSEDFSRYIAPIYRPECARRPNIPSLMPIIKQADIIVLASNWNQWGAKFLLETITNMHLSFNQKLFVIGTKSFGETINIRKLLYLGREKRAKLRYRVIERALSINRIMKNNLSPEVFINQIEIICGDNESCPIVTPEDNLIAWDGNHLTVEGAKYIGNKLFQQSALSQTK